MSAWCSVMDVCAIQGVFLRPTQCFWDKICVHRDPVHDKAVTEHKTLDAHIYTHKHKQSGCRTED